MTAAAALRAVRPEPHRGPLAAAGVVVLTVAVIVINGRMDEAWAAGIHLLYAVPAAALVLAMALGSPVDEAPRPSVSVLLVASFALAVVVLGELAGALGGGLSSSGTLTWTGALLTAGAAALAVVKRSAVMTLVAAVTAIVTVLAATDWIFDLQEPLVSFRYVLVGLVALLVLGAVRLRDRRRRHAVALVDAAGIALVLVGLSLLAGAILSVFAQGGEVGQAATGWEVVLLVGGCGLLAYATADREPGPAYLGVGVLLLFATLAGQEAVDGSASVLFWPLLLVLLGAGVVAAALRPSRELPPEPGRAGGGDAPGPPPEPAPLHRPDIAPGAGAPDRSTPS